MIEKELHIGWTLHEVETRLSVYTKAELDKHFGFFVKSFFSGEKEWLLQQDDRIQEVVSKIENIIASQKTTKGAILTYYALPFLNPECFKRFVTYLPEDTQTILEDIVLNGPAEHPALEKKFGIKAAYKGGKTGWANRYPLVPSPDLRLFSIPSQTGYYNYYSDSRAIKYFLPNSVRELMTHLLFPHPVAISPYDPQAKTAYEKLIEAEQITLQELPGLLIRLQQKPLKLTQKGRPSIASVRAIRKKLQIREFFPESEEADLQNLRTQALAGLLSLRKSWDTNNIAELIKSLFEKEFTSKFHIPIHFMGYIKGINRIEAYYYKHNNIEYLDIIKTLPVEQWISFPSIEYQLKTARWLISPIHPGGMHNLTLEIPDYDPESRFSHTRTLGIHPYWVEKLIVWPALRATLFVMASWGLIDMIYEKPNLHILSQTADSPFDGIKAIRVNALGAYVLGNTENYTSDVKAPFTLELAEDSLTILLTDGDSERAQMAISSFAASLGKKRFYTDSSLFLGDCKTPADLEHKISIFKTIFSDKLPAHWEAFFKEVSLKVNPIEKENSFVVFRLDHDNRSLLKLIVQDTKLKKMCLKAEGYLILIPKRDLKKFKNRLQEFGYLLE